MPASQVVHIGDSQAHSKQRSSFIGRYGKSVLAVCAANLIALLLQNALDVNFPFGLSFLAVLFAVQFYGMGPAIVAAVTGGVSASYFFIPPQPSFAFERADLATMPPYFALCTCAILIIRAKQRAQNASEVQARLAESRLMRLEQEVAARVESQEAAKGTSARLSAVLESTTDCVMALDPEFRFTYLNERARATISQDRDIVGMTLLEAFPAASGTLIETGFQRVMQDRVPVSFEAFYEPLNTWFEIHAYPDQEGGLAVYFRDIADRRKSDSALRESEERFRAAVEGMLDGFGIFSAIRDQKGNIIDFAVEYVNDAGCSFARLKRAEQIGRRLFEVFPCAQTEGLVQECRAIVETGRPLINEEFTFEQRCEGETKRRIFDLRASKLGDGFAAVWRELTAQKRIEEELRISEQRRGLALEAADMGTWHVDLRTGEVLWSDRRKAQAGLPPDAVIGPDTFNQTIHPEDREAVREAVRRTAEAGAPYDVEYRTVWPDGTVHWLAAKGRAEHDADGTPIGLHGVVIDIDKRKRMEREVMQANERLRALINACPLGIISVDRWGIVQSWNPAAERIFGWTAQEVIGKEVPTVPEDRLEEYQAIRDRTLTGEANADLELVRRRKDGSLIDISLFDAPLRDSSGEIVGRLAIMADITQRKRLEAHLRQTQKLESIGLLAGGIAHDFNNLLTGIIGNVSMAAEHLPPGSSAQAMLQGAIRSSERASDLTRQLLAYAGKGAFFLKRLDVSKAIEDDLELLKASIPKGVQLETDLTPDLPRLEIDPSQLQQLVMNLVINGAEAISGEKPGTVTIRTRLVKADEAFVSERFRGQPACAGTYVCVEVEDTGSGMDTHTRERMFDPFFTTKFTGRGLGLAAVQGILRSLKGGLAVETAPGQGTRFEVYLPVAAPEVECSESARLVMVVDDEPEVRRVAKAALERRGYRVLLAGDGGEALTLIDKHAGDVGLVLLDVTMPVYGGEQILPMLRSRKPDLKVVVSSGHSEADVRSMFENQGVSGFLQKPYTPANLVEVVARAITKT